MFQQKKPRDYRAMWVVSIVILVLGILLTMRLALLRPLGYALLGVGGVLLVISLANMDTWKDKKDKDNMRHFN
jgi:hypothetical protein